MIGNGGNFGFDMGALLGNMMSNGNNNGGFGNDGGIWAIILIIALCGGFNNGDGGLFGNRGGGGTSAGTAAVEASLQRGFDNQSVLNKLNGLENGVCNLGYSQLGQTNDVTSAITSSSNSIQQALQNLMVSLMQQGFAQSTQAQQCCCNIENLLQQANYNRQADTCSITNAINQMGQAIMQNDNANARQLHDEQVDIQMQAKDAQIAQLTAALSRCDNKADNAEQTSQIIGQLMAYLNPPTVRAIPANSGLGWGTWSNGSTCCGNNGNFFGFV